MTIIVVDIITAASPPPILLHDESHVAYNRYHTHRVVQKDRKTFVNDLAGHKYLIPGLTSQHILHLQHFREAGP